MTNPHVQDFSLTLDKFLEHAARWRPHARVATATGSGKAARISYADLLSRARRFSAGLRQLGVVAGDRVATLAWNTQGHVEAWYAIAGGGAIVHTLNPRLAIETLASQARKADACLLIAASSLAPQAAELARQAPSIRHVIVIDDKDEFDPSQFPVAASAHEDVLAGASDEPPVAWGEFDEHAAAGLCFTSGTTGAPKGVVYTHRSSYLHTLRLLQADVMGLTEADNVLMVVPMFHANGWGLPFAAPAAGASLILPGRHTDGPSLAALIRQESVTLAAAVPTVWLGLLDHLDAANEEVPTLKRIVVGGAPMSRQLMARLEARTGAIVQTSWGMTELAPLGAIAPAGLAQREAASAGRVAIGLDLLLRDEQGRALPQQRGFEGRLHVKGQSAVRQYYGEAEPATDAEGWFDTGDLARITADGSLYITGRAKDLIKSGGEWINPAEIEALVTGLPDVAQAAVIARRDEKWGERPVLVLETRDGASVADAEVQAALRDRIPSWWMPDAIIRLEKLPLAATGKVDKQKLRADFGGS